MEFCAFEAGKGNVEGRPSVAIVTEFCDFYDKPFCGPGRPVSVTDEKQWKEVDELV